LAQSPLNPVDNIILTHLSYLPLDGIVPGPEAFGKSKKKHLSIWEASKILTAILQKKGTLKNTKHINLMFKEDHALLHALVNARRFWDMQLAGFVNKIDPVQEKQFAALTILTGDKHAFITYRGTDSSLIGWKEDFTMAFSDTIPAQTEAVRYLEEMADSYKMPLRLGGHSKGGNLAVYAASFCSKKNRKRIAEIYVNDAPGFNHKVIKSEGYQAVKHTIRSYVPENSVIGMLFDHDTDYTVVKSTTKGIMQHDVYTWEIMGNNLVSLDRVSKGSLFIGSTMKDWINSLDTKQRKAFIDVLFSILYSTEAHTFTELGSDWLKNSLAILQSITNIDKHSRKMIIKTLRTLFRAARKNITVLLPDEGQYQTGQKQLTGVEFPIV
jgi:hypothetical protein